MDYDLRGALNRLTDEPVAGENDLPLTVIAGRVRRDRLVRTTAYTCVAAAATVALVLGVRTVSPWSTEPAPPAEPDATSSPQPVPTSDSSRSPSSEPSVVPPPTPDTSPTPTPTPQAFRPDLASCGSTVAGADYDGMWVGNYGGGVGADPGAPVGLRWAVIIDEDWSDRQVTATVDGLLMLSGEEVGTVVAVPAAQLPGPFPITFTSGSEGGGTGSEGRIDLTVPFVTCADGSASLPVGLYRGSVQVTLDDGTTTWSARGDVPVYVGGAVAVEGTS